MQERSPGLSETATASQPCPARTSEEQFLPRELQKSGKQPACSCTETGFCSGQHGLKGLRPRKGAEGSLTRCTPGKGVKVGGSPESRLAAGGEEWDSPSLPGAARYPAAREMGIPTWQRNRAQPFPFSLAVHRTASQGANCEQTCMPKVLNKFTCCT